MKGQFFLLIITFFIAAPSYGQGFIHYHRNWSIEDIEIKDSLMWVLTDRSIVKRDLHGNLLAEYPEGFPDRLVSFFNHILLDDSSVLWALLDGELYRLTDKNKLEKVLGYVTDVPDIFQTDSFGNIWLGGFETLYKYDGEKWISIDVGKYESFSTHELLITDYFLDKHGIIWGLDWEPADLDHARTYPLIYKYENNSWNFIDTLYQDYGNIIKVDLDEKDQIIFTTDSARYKWENGQSTLIGPVEKNVFPNLYGSSPITAEDSYGNVYGYSAGTGLHKLEDGKWLPLTQEAIPSNNISSMVIDANNKVWFPAGSSLIRFDESSYSEYPADPSLLPDPAYDPELSDISADSEGIIWGIYGYGRYNKIFSFDGQNWKTYQDTSVYGKEALDDLIIDSQDNIWIVNQQDIRVGGQQGASSNEGFNLTKFDRETFTKYPCYVDNGNNILPVFLSEDRNGGFWAVQTPSYEDSLRVFRFNGESWKEYFFDNHFPVGYNSEGRLLLYKHVSNWPAPWLKVIEGYELVDFTSGPVFLNKGLHGTDGKIIAAEDKSGNIWIRGNSGTGGIFRYDGKNFLHFTKEDGLPVDDIVFMAPDHAGSVWFGTGDNGLIKYSEDIINGNFFAGNNHASADIIIYPNPVREALHISQIDPGAEVIINSVEGKLLYSGKTTSRIDVNDYEKGLYILRIKTDEGVISKPFIKD